MLSTNKDWIHSKNNLKSTHIINIKLFDCVLISYTYKLSLIVIYSTFHQLCYHFIYFTTTRIKIPNIESGGFSIIGTTSISNRQILPWFNYNATISINC